MARRARTIRRRIIHIRQIHSWSNRKRSRVYDYELYWSLQPEVLFFGLYSEIGSGRMQNKVIGANDYLIVEGDAGSETYQCPNTIDYQTADTDYIWFKTDVSQRTTTTAELIGYDFSRTIIKYLDDSPKSIQAILILKSSVSSIKRDKLFQDFRLSVFWDDEFNDNGFIKSNRGAERSVWAAEEVYDSASIALFNRMTALLEEPTTSQKQNINTCIVALKAAGLFDTQWDVFVVTRGHGIASTKLNWVKNAHNAIALNTPLYSESVGYLRNAANSGLNTKYKPSTQKVLYEQDNASFILKRSSVGAGGGSQGVIGSHDTIIYDSVTCAINASTTSTGTLGSNSDGWRCLSRASSANFINMFNSSQETLTKTSTGVPDYELYILAQNNWGSYTGQVQATAVNEFYAIGKSITQAKFLELQTIMNTYFAGL